MEYIKLLQRKTIAILWLSQLLSAIGDQIYVVSACWLAAQISPSALAIVAASEYLSAFLFSFIAGVLTDRFNKKHLMIFADLIRAAAVLTLPIASIFYPVNTWHLALVGIILGAFGVLFDPCLVAIIPKLTEDNKLLQATNGLIDFTKRIARTLGPALAGILAIFVPIHFVLGLNAVSFFVSAAGITYVARQINLNDIKATTKSLAFASELMTAARLIKSHSFMTWELVIYFFANIAWSITYTAGLPLITKEKFGDSIAAYGLLISIYGFASVIANIAMGNRKTSRGPMSVFLAYVGWGVGFMTMACAPNIVLAAFGLIIAALSGPVIFITILTMVQKEIPASDIGKVYSFRVAAMYSGLGLGLMLSSYLFSHWKPSAVMPWASGIYLVMGISGILRFYKPKKISNSTSS